MPLPGSPYRQLDSLPPIRTMPHPLHSSSPHRPYYNLPYHPHAPHDQPHEHRCPSYHHASLSDFPSHSRAEILPPEPASSASYPHQPAANTLAPGVQRPMHQLVPEQQLQLADIHRFTPSCSRCRQKKLKCDTNLPCNQCIAKGVHDDCRKDSRIPRGRKRPKLAPPSSTDNANDEIAFLRKRVKELEQIIARKDKAASSSQPSSPSTSHRPLSKHAASSYGLGTSSRGSQTTGPSELGYSQSRERYSIASPSSDSDEDEVGDMETSLSTLEKLAASDPRVSEPGHGKAMYKQINSVTPRQISRRTCSSYFSAPAAFNERIEIIKLAKRILPEKHLVDTLIYTFNLRCHNLVGRIVHMPSFQKDIDFFTRASIEDLLTAPQDMSDLARYLMILRLGMRFYPWKGGMFIDDTTPEFTAINALKNRGDDISLQWLNLAKRALALDRDFSLNSLPAIQTAILMLLDGRESPSYLRMLLRISIQTALDMGLHRLGNAMPSPNNPDDDIIHIESGVRIWWYLVVKDWCSAQREGAYTIHPSQMTTRKPLHTTDARLSEGRTDEISLDDYCETSYTLCQIELANIIRESIDLRNEQSTLGGAYDVISPNNKKLLHVKLETFLSDLPPFYRLDSTEMRPGVLAVQRCLLHQQTFDVLLKLNRKSLSSYSERATCALLAEQIVSTQKLLRSVCPVIDGFWVNFLHLFGATLTLTISLLLDDDLTEETRSRRRGKVHTALATMRETPGSDRGSQIIETLLQEEQKQWAAGPKDSSRRKLNFAALTRRIVAQTSELAGTPARTETITTPIEGSSSSCNLAQNFERNGGVGILTWDTTPDESVVPAFASSWGADITDPTDPTGLLSSYVPQLVEDGQIDDLGPKEPCMYHRPPTRPYEHSLRPWQEPSQAATSNQACATNGIENNLWDWVFSQAVIHCGPEPPVEGPPRAAITSKASSVVPTPAWSSSSASRAALPPISATRIHKPASTASEPSSASTTYSYSYSGQHSHQRSSYSSHSSHSSHSHSSHSHSPRAAAPALVPSVLSPLPARDAPCLLPDRAGVKSNTTTYTHTHPPPLPPPPTSLRGWSDHHASRS